MKNSANNGKRYPFNILLLTFLFLVVLSLWNTEFSLFGFQFRKIDILADIKSESLENKPIPVTSTTEETPVDTAQLKSLDTLMAKEFIAPPNITETLDSVRREFKTKKHLRIAHFGDSMIEGDLITSDIRGYLQKNYGGAGVGFLPMTSVVAQFRTTIHMEFSDNWQTNSIIEFKKSELPIGISGFVFKPHVNSGITDISKMTSSWTEYSWKHSKVPKPNMIRLFYSQLHGFAHAKFSSGDSVIYDKLLDTGSTLKSCNLAINSSMTGIKIEIFTNTTFPVHGVTLEDTAGVLIDNFSLRGNSGLALSKLDYHLMKEFDSQLHYDLIILQYGLNAAGPNDTSLYWYTSGMTKVVNYMRSIFPRTAMLLVTVGDRDVKYNTDFQTAPCIEHLLKSQYQVAKVTKCDLWDLYTAMGGLNSMRDWVNLPPLAAKDYAHLSPQGARKVATLMTNFIVGNPAP